MDGYVALCASTVAFAGWSAAQAALRAFAARQTENPLRGTRKRPLRGLKERGMKWFPHLCLNPSSPTWCQTSSKCCQCCQCCQFQYQLSIVNWQHWNWQHSHGARFLLRPLKPIYRCYPFAHSQSIHRIYRLDPLDPLYPFPKSACPRNPLPPEIHCPQKSSSPKTW